MDSIQKLQPIEKSNDEIRKTVLKNVVKMLYERGYINKNDLDNEIKNITSFQSTDYIYKIKIDYMNDKTLIVKILPQKITSVSKSSAIGDFLNEYRDFRKIVIVNNISKKAMQYVRNNYSKTEIFTEEEMMINLIDNVLVPKHEILPKEEALNFYEKFNCKKRNMPKLLSGDPVARYYNMKPDDIVRIIRNSKLTGHTVSYRLVVKGDPK